MYQTTPRPIRNSPIFAAMTVAAILGAKSLQAGDVAYWRFEEGPAGANVARNGQADGTFYGAVADSSGNGNTLSAWSDGSYAGYSYRANVGSSFVPETGAANNFSVKNTGGSPAMFTQTGSALQTWTPSQWTIEASFKLENGGYRTIVGRDSKGATPNPDGNLAAMYLQAIPGNALAIKYADVSGVWHEAVSAQNIFTGFDFPTDNDGNLAPWYSMAATSDGSTLSLYLRQMGVGDTGWNLIAQTDMTGSGSANTAMSAGTGSGSDWSAGNFSVGRGLYNGGHTDRAYGYIDEVRFSDAALNPGSFLMSTPEPGTAALVLVGMGVVAIRRRQRA